MLEKLYTLTWPQILFILKIKTVGELQYHISKFHIDKLLLFRRWWLGSESFVKSLIFSFNTGDHYEGGDQEDEGEETEDHQSNVPVIFLHHQAVLKTDVSCEQGERSAWIVVLSLEYLVAKHFILHSSYCACSMEDSDIYPANISHNLYDKIHLLHHH